MKKKKNTKKSRFIINNKFHLGFGMIVVILLFMTIGFSALQQTLYIGGGAKIEKPEYLIYIDKVTLGLSTTGDNSYENVSPMISNTTVSTYYALTTTTSRITYKMTIINAGRTSGILDYTVINSDSDQVKCKIKGINNGDIIPPGSSIDVDLIFEYWDDVSVINNINLATMVDFQFRPVDDTYNYACTNNWDGSSTSQPILVDVFGVNYYQINNANEFAWFVNTVNSGSTNINAYLTKDICLNSNYLQINDFTGIFDGQNRSINGLSYSKNVSLTDNYSEVIGLFKNNHGHIKNLNLSINFSDTLSYKPPLLGGNDVITQQIGGLVANNAGKISNVSVSGQFTGNYTMTTSCAIARPEFYNYVAGVAGTNSGVITGAANKTNIAFSYTSTSSACNYRKSPYLYSGGIVGQNSGYISDSYNNSSVSSTVTSEDDNSHYYGKLGGVVGDVTGGVVKNVYSAGSFSHTASVEDSSSVVETTSGCVVANNAGTITSAFYPNTCTYGGYGTAVNAGDLTSLSVSLGNYFIKDTLTSNNGYPILGWQ